MAISDVTHWAKGINAGPGSPSAFHHLEQLAHAVTQHLAAIDRLESAVSVGGRDVAAAWGNELEDFAVATGAAWRPPPDTAAPCSPTRRSGAAL